MHRTVLWHNSRMHEETRKRAGAKDANAPVRHDNAAHESRKKDAGGGAETAREVGGRRGPDPTRFGDWEKNGRCIDF